MFIVIYDFDGYSEIHYAFEDSSSFNTKKEALEFIENEYKQFDRLPEDYSIFVRHGVKTTLALA